MSNPCKLKVQDCSWICMMPVRAELLKYNQGGGSQSGESALNRRGKGVKIVCFRQTYLSYPGCLRWIKIENWESYKVKPWKLENSINTGLKVSVFHTCTNTASACGSILVCSEKTSKSVAELCERGQLLAPAGPPTLSLASQRRSRRLQRRHLPHC